LFHGKTAARSQAIKRGVPMNQQTFSDIEYESSEQLQIVLLWNTLAIPFILI